MTSEKDIIVSDEHYVDIKRIINENQINMNITSIKTPVASSERGAGWTSTSMRSRSVSTSPPNLLFYGGVGRGATPFMMSTAVGGACSKIKVSAVSGRLSRNSVISMNEKDLRNKFKYLEDIESAQQEQKRRMKESKRHLEMKQETLRRLEQLCRETSDDHLQQM